MAAVLDVGGLRSRGAVIAVALVAGLAVGRFVTYDGGGASPGAMAPQVRLADRVAELERRVAKNPGDLLGWQSLGTAYVRRAFEVGDPSFYDLAVKALDRAEALRPGDSGTLLGRALLFLALHRFDEALPLGAEVARRQPDSAGPLGVVVDAQVEQGDYEGAAVTLQRMLDLRPDLSGLSRASYLRELNGDVPGALAAMAQAEEAGIASPFDGAVVATLSGDLLLRQRRVEAASAKYEYALERAPDLVTAQFGRAKVLAAEERYPEAIETLDRLVQRVPYPDAVRLLGELQARSGDEQGAVRTADLVRAMARLQEASGQVVDLEMSVFESDLGDPVRALSLARQVLEARPGNVYAADAMAWALLRNGQTAAAVPLAERALRLGSADALVRYRAAEVFAAAGDLDRARRELETAVGLVPWGLFRYQERAQLLGARLGVAVPPVTDA